MSFFLPVFRLLNDAEVRYVVVGGIATILHGYVRATSDIDLVVDLHAEEASKAIRALVSGGFAARVPVDPMQFADQQIRAEWIEAKGMKVFSLFHKDAPELNVDLFSHHPVPFDDLWSNSVVMNLDGIPIRVCSIDHLIELKRIAGRHKDLADIEQLIKIKAYGQEIPGP